VRRAVRPLPAVVLLLSLAAPAGAQPAAPAKPDWSGTGVVLALLPSPSDLHATRPVIVIRHDPIPGLMDESMSMPFIAATPTLFARLRTGDRIAFGLKDTPGALLVISISRLPR
jgi:Cu/Ag efflux protein CusF